MLGVLEDRSVGFKNLNGLFQELIFILNSFAYFSKDLNVGGALWSLIIISTFAIAIEPKQVAKPLKTNYGKIPRSHLLA